MRKKFLNYLKKSLPLQEQWSSSLAPAAAAVAAQSIIYRMKENLLNKTKTLASPPGIDGGLWNRYVEQIRDSDGFDLDESNFPEGSDYATLSVLKFEKDEQDRSYRNLRELSIKALEWMTSNNVKEGEGFEFVDVVKANVMQGGMGILFSYFITFKSKNRSDEMKYFQAKAESRPQISNDNFFTDVYPGKIEFCRMKAS